MKSKVKHIPDGFHAVTPYLTVKNAADAIEFYQSAFGAEERVRMPMPDGKIGHAELMIGNSIIMLGDEFPQCNQSPETLNGTPVSFCLYVKNVDEAFERAVEAGAAVKEPVDNKFWGDRAGTVMDPFGHRWTLLTHFEDVAPKEMKKRMEKMFAAAPA